MKIECQTVSFLIDVVLCEEFVCEVKYKSWLSKYAKVGVQ